jgi:hypothetical protein
MASHATPQAAPVAGGAPASLLHRGPERVRNFSEAINNEVITVVQGVFRLS